MSDARDVPSADDVARDCLSRAVSGTGVAGPLCLMHTRLLHGSRPNLSASPRTLFIAVSSAEDAVPLTPNPVASRHQGEVVRGVDTGRLRVSPYEIPLPQLPDSAMAMGKPPMEAMISRRRPAKRPANSRPRACSRLARPRTKADGDDPKNRRQPPFSGWGRAGRGGPG